MAEAILLTGGTGFIGFWTLRALLSSSPRTTRIRTPVRALDKARALLTHPILADLDASSRVDLVSVPDITAEGAYDEVLRGCTAAIHLASPLGSRWTPQLEAEKAAQGIDAEAWFREPTVRGTLGILNSAAKVASMRDQNHAPALKRVVLVTGAFAPMTFSQFTRGDDTVTVYNARYRASPDVAAPKLANNSNQGPNPFFFRTNMAYTLAKNKALAAAEEWARSHTPLPFEVTSAFLGFCIGPNPAHEASAQDALYGTNGIVFNPMVRGIPPAIPIPPVMVDVRDAAQALAVLALKERGELEKVNGAGSGILLKNGGVAGVRWEEVRGIVDSNFAEAISNGHLTKDLAMKSGSLNLDDEGAEELLGFRYRKFEETIKDLVSWYLEVVEKDVERTEKA